MAFCLMKSLSRESSKSLSAALRLRSPEVIGPTSTFCVQNLLYSTTKRVKIQEITAADELISPHPQPDYDIPASGISRPISIILKELNKKISSTLIKSRTESDGFSIKYLPWYIVNKIMNMHAPEWSGEVRNITYSADGKYVSVTYRVTIHGDDTELFRESTGTSSVTEVGYGDPVRKAEAMAFRRACARFGLGLHLYHEEL